MTDLSPYGDKFNYNKMLLIGVDPDHCHHDRITSCNEVLQSLADLGCDTNHRDKFGMYECTYSPMV